MLRMRSIMGIALIAGVSAITSHAQAACSTGSFALGSNWTGIGYWGSVDQIAHFADVNGDGKADAIVVNATSITVRLSTGTSFGPNQTWSSTAFYGSIGTQTTSTYFEDVNGDRCADVVVVNDVAGGHGVWLRLSDCSTAFLPAVYLAYSIPFYNTDGNPPLLYTYFADMDGDGKQDMVCRGPNSHVYVAFANGLGTGFDPAVDVTSAPFYGEVFSGFGSEPAGVAATAIAVHSTSPSDPTAAILGRWSNGLVFPPPNLTFAAVNDYGRNNSYNQLADIDNSGYQSLIYVSPTDVQVRCGGPTGFSTSLHTYTGGALPVGSRGSYFADVNNDGRADAISTQNDGVYVRINQL